MISNNNCDFFNSYLEKLSIPTRRLVHIEESKYNGGVMIILNVSTWGSLVWMDAAIMKLVSLMGGDTQNYEALLVNNGSKVVRRILITLKQYTMPIQ